MPDGRVKVIYLMGAGHVGSTVIDIVLSSHPRIESLGEVSKFHRYGWNRDERRRCACGAVVHDCPFWTRVRERWSELTGSRDAHRYMFLQPRFERTAAGWLRLLGNRVRSTSAFREYLSGTEALYRSAAETGRSDYVVDCSLTPKRAYAQVMNPQVELYLIHLVRDGRGVIWSLMKPKERNPEYVPAPPARTTKYWLSANLQSTWVFHHVPDERRLRIRYEDFVLEPRSVLSRIEDMVGEDLSGLVEGNALTNPNSERHTVAGNRVRFVEDADLRLRADFAWMDNLGEPARALFWRRAGWLARRYGYVKDQIDYATP